MKTYVANLVVPFALTLFLLFIFSLSSLSDGMVGRQLATARIKGANAARDGMPPDSCRFLRVDLRAAWTEAYIAAAPERPEPKQPKDAPPPALMFPDISGETNWGVVAQDAAGNVTITGHEHWRAEGKFVRKGATWDVHVTWTLHTSGRTGPGVYVVHPHGTLKGHWNYSDRAAIDGLTLTDEVFRLSRD